MKGERDMRRQVSYVNLFTVALLAVVILMSGCTLSLPPIKPIKDFKEIAGTWEGFFITGKGRTIWGTTIIRADGTLTKKGPRGIINGTLKLTNDGKAVTKEGTFTLHEGGGKRVLSFSTSSGSAQYKPAK